MPRNVLELTRDVVDSYARRNRVHPQALHFVVKEVAQALEGCLTPPVPVLEPSRERPAVPISRSIKDDHIVCLEDGKKLVMLKRYLRTRYGLSPDEYRQKWKLPQEYPMVCPAYARTRSATAKRIGLGTRIRSI